MINMREIYAQVVGLRPDLAEGQVLAEVTEAAIKTARDTNLLLGTLFATLPSGKSSVTLSIPPDRTLNRIETVWVRDPGDSNAQWQRIRECASKYVEDQKWASDSKPVGSFPSDWSLRNGVLSFSDPSDATYPLRITYSWVPLRYPEPIALPFPAKAEDGILAATEFRILRLPGKARDIEAAERSRMRYESLLSGLKAMADSGESGSRSIFDFLPQE